MTVKAVTGLNGAGKSALAVSMLRRAAGRGFKIAANVKVDGAEYVTDYEQLLNLKHCLLLLDDVTAVASSRSYASMTPEALLFFQTLRHSDISVIWTAPTFDRADIALRSVTREWTDVRALVTRRMPHSLWRNTVVALTVSGRPKADPTAPMGYRLDAPWPSLFRPAKVHQYYDSFADLNLFTPDQFPTRCKICGVYLTYPRVPAESHLTAHPLYVDALPRALGDHEHVADTVDD